MQKAMPAKPPGCPGSPAPADPHLPAEPDADTQSVAGEEDPGAADDSVDAAPDPVGRAGAPPAQARRKP